MKSKSCSRVRSPPCATAGPPPAPARIKVSGAPARPDGGDASGCAKIGLRLFSTPTSVGTRRSEWPGRACSPLQLVRLPVAVMSRQPCAGECPHGRGRMSGATRGHEEAPRGERLELRSLNVKSPPSPHLHAPSDESSGRAGHAAQAIARIGRAARGTGLRYEVAAHADVQSPIRQAVLDLLRERDRKE